jgi:hypothetical protein
MDGALTALSQWTAASMICAVNDAALLARYRSPGE